MALYTPQAQRRRRLVILAVGALLLGAILGAFAGRFTAPTPADRVAQVREQARQITAQLRVLSLHADAGAASLGADGDAGARLALQRADNDLRHTLDQAPWITPEQGNALRAQLGALINAASGAAATAQFAADVDRLAADIDHTFNVASKP